MTEEGGKGREGTVEDMEETDRRTSRAASLVSLTRDDRFGLGDRLRAPSGTGRRRAFDNEGGLEDAQPGRPPVFITSHLFQWSRLRSISQNIYDPRTLISHGRPTVMVAASSICVGTEQGRCLVFGYDQKIVTAIALTHPVPVTALAVSSDGKRIALGQADGTLTLIALANPHKPQTIRPMKPEDLKNEWKDTHMTGSIITHLDFLGGRSDLLVSRDQHGLAFFWLLTSLLGFSGLDVRRLAGQYPTSGSAQYQRGALAIAACPLGTQPHPSDQECLVALLTLRKVIILRTRPETQVLSKMAIDQDSNEPVKTSSFHLVWYPSIQIANQGQSVPLLACSRAQEITIFAIQSEATTKTRQVGRYTLPEGEDNSIDALSFVAHESLLVLVKDRLYILSLDDGTFARSSSSITLHRFRTETQPLSLSNSISVRHGQIYCLTENSLDIAIRSTWADNILALVGRQDFIGAVRLAITYYRQADKSSLLGLPRQERARQVLIGNRIRSLIKSSLNFAFDPDRLKDGTLAGTMDQGIDPSQLFIELAALSIEAAMLKDPTLESLVQEVYDRFVKAGIQSIFLDSLGHAIQQESKIELPPAISQALILYYSAEKPNDLEGLICSMEPGTLDIDLALSISRSLHLEKAEIHVLTRALQDWTSPCAKFIMTIDENKEELFQYITSVWSGYDYPFARTLSRPECEEAQKQIFGLIFSGRFRGTPEYRMPVIVNAERSGNDNYLYPYLRLLLSLDPERFLDILDLALENSWFDEEVEAEQGGLGPSRVYSRQAIIEALIEINNQEDEKVVSDDAKTFVAIFIAKNLPKYPQKVRLPADLIDQILRSLCLDQSTQSNRLDREYATECILSTYQPNWTIFEPAFRQSGFWRILAAHYRKLGKEGNLFEAMKMSSLGEKERAEAISRMLSHFQTMPEDQRNLSIQVLADWVPSLDLNEEVVGEMAAKMGQSVFELCELVKDEECLVDLLSRLERHLLFNSDQMKMYLSMLIGVRPQEVYDKVKSLTHDGRNEQEYAEILSDDRVFDARLFLVAQDSSEEAIRQGVEALKITLLEEDTREVDLTHRLGMAMYDIMSSRQQPIELWSTYLQGLIESSCMTSPTSTDGDHAIEKTINRSVEHILQSRRPAEIKTIVSDVVLASSKSSQQTRIQRSLVTTIRDARILEFSSITSIYSLSTLELLSQSQRVNLIRKRGTRLRPLHGQLHALSPQEAFKQHKIRSIPTPLPTQIES